MLIYLRRLRHFEEEVRQLKINLKLKVVVPRTYRFLMAQALLIYLRRLRCLE